MKLKGTVDLTIIVFRDCAHYECIVRGIGDCFMCGKAVLGDSKNRKCFKAKTPCANCNGLSQYNLDRNADMPGENVIEISCATCANKEAKDEQKGD
jgi:hypothetical protein